MNRLQNSYSTCMSCGGRKMKSGGWIQKAIKNPGSFTKQAQSAGMSVAGFKNKVLANKEDFSSTTVKRANLANTLSKMRKGQDGMAVNLEGTDPSQIPMMDSNTMRRKEMLMEREAQLQEKKNGAIPENQMAPMSMMRGGRLYAQLGMLNGVPIQGPKPAPVATAPAKPAAKVVSNEEGMDEVPRVQAIDPKLTQAKAMLKQDNKALEMAKVKDYQTMLNQKYNAGLATDGAWGPKTQAAYEKYMVASKAAPTSKMGPSRADMPGNFKMNFNTNVPKGTMGPTRADMTGKFKMNFSTSAPLAATATAYKGTSQPLWQTAKGAQSFLPGKAGDMVVNESYSFINKQPAKTNQAKVGSEKKKAAVATKQTSSVPLWQTDSNNQEVDKRQLPQTGVVVDRGTNQTYVFGKNKNFEMPVLTGQNRDKNANSNMGTVEELEKNKKGRVTPPGYYIMNSNSAAADKKEYGNNIRNLDPIAAFGVPKAKAENIAIHQTYNPGFRNQFYNKSADERGQSYGCINGRCGDIEELLRQVPGQDTVMVIDSRFKKDKVLLGKAQQRVKKPK